jgi:catechol 2,3-dioxygenase-like lactoylglutathione lyase family enzyme
MKCMKFTRQMVTVFDAADMAAESAFWAAVLGGMAEQTDDDWTRVYDAQGERRIAVQLAPDHVAPEWPDGAPQQAHVDLYVEDLKAAHEEVIALGARLLQAAPDLDAAQGFQVYADPAGHPFCLCWGS